MKWQLERNAREVQGERRGNAGRNVRGAWWTREERFHDVTLKEGKMVGKRGASLVTKPQGTGITNSLSATHLGPPFSVLASFA